LLLAGLAGAGAYLRPFRVEVTGSSMEPALSEGDWLIATRGGRIGAGAIVVLRHPRREMDLVKRVSAVPGDEVDGRTLGPDEFVVVGDNEAASTDGRHFGAVKRDGIEGLVRLRYHPRFGLIR
jgi:nickel-type superoxide dismutase maturation protease